MPDNATYLGFDYGRKHIGVAVGQTVTRTASPLASIRAQNGRPDWSAMDKIIAEWRPAGLVVGLPLNMDDTMSDIAREAKHFARTLTKRYHIPAETIDERLSTHAAKQWYQEHHGRAPTKTELDTLAAVIILESFLS